MTLARPTSGSSIRVVANRTGIGAHTLRVWERRYGFPKPERRSGGVRDYSEVDIAKLKLVAQALEAGFRPGEVVPLTAEDLSRLLDATRLDLADAARVRGPSRVGVASVGEAGLEGLAPSTNELVDQIVEALTADDIEAVQSTLRSAARTFGPKRFVTDLGHPLALRIGELWGQKKLDVRHEHLATACLTRQLHTLDPSGDEEQWPVVVLATLPGEHHVLPLDMVGVYLAASNASPRMLGADTPPGEIAGAARAMKADVVGISISAAADRDAAAAGLRELLGELPRRTELWVGGAGGEAVALHQGVVHVDGWAALDRKLRDMRAGRAA